MSAPISRILQSVTELSLELSSTDDDHDGTLVPEELAGGSFVQRLARDYFVARMDRLGTQAMSVADATGGVPNEIEATRYDRNGDGSLSTYEAAFAPRELQVLQAYAARMSGKASTLSPEDRGRQFGQNAMAALVTVDELATGVVASATETEAAIDAVTTLISQRPVMAGISLSPDDATVVRRVGGPGEASMAQDFENYRAGLVAAGKPVSPLTPARIADYMELSCDRDASRNAVRIPYTNTDGAPGVFYVVRSGETYTVLGLPTVL